MFNVSQIPCYSK